MTEGQSTVRSRSRRRPGSRTRILVARAIATGGGVGYSPVAPGTCGTLVAVPLVWGCRYLDTCQYLGVVALVAFCGVVAADIADRSWTTRDSQRIVVDEVAGYSLTMALVDRGNAAWLLAGFVLFRVLDIAKPGPIRWLDRNVHGGLGVMIDDLAAGVTGACTLYAIDRWL